MDVNIAMSLKEYSGVITDSLCLMSVVEWAPMTKGHTYPSKEIAMMRIAEEANFSGCPVSIGRSDDRRVSAFGRSGSTVVVKVVLSDKFGWRLSECDTRSAQAIRYGGADMAPGELDPLVVGTPKEAIIEVGTAEGDEENNNFVNETPTKANRTPFLSLNG